MTHNKISPGIVINHVDRSFHVLILTTGDISMIPSFETHFVINGLVGWLSFLIVKTVIFVFTYHP